MKRIYWLALLIPLVCSPIYYGQTSRAITTTEAVLAHGEPPLTEGMVSQIRDVMEWLLNAQFSGAQQEQFKRLIVTDWQRRDRQAIDTYLNCLQLHSQLGSATEEQRKAAHAQIQPTFVKALYQPPVEEMSRLLISVYESGKESNLLDRVSSSPPNVDNSARPAVMPAELIGEWIARRGSGSSYHNPQTGSYGAPNATTDSYKFFADGRYEHAILMTSSLYNCSIRIFGHETGAYVAAGNTLTITPEPGTLSYTDNCRPHLNSKKSTQMNGKRWQWQLGRDEYGVKLCVRDQKGAATCYYRQ